LFLFRTEAYLRDTNALRTRSRVWSRFSGCSAAFHPTPVFRLFPQSAPGYAVCSIASRRSGIPCTPSRARPAYLRCCREMSPDTGEAESEYPPRNKAATPPRFPYPFRCGLLRHSSISPAPAWRSFDLRNGCRHLQVPIRREFPLCPRSSPRGYREASLRPPNPDTFLVRKPSRKQTATLPCPQADEPATLD